MNYTDRFNDVTVLGAAGKMGSGILLLTAMEMADLSLKPENKGKQFVINAMDVSSEALMGLMSYIRAQVLKAAEKKAVLLRKFYADRNDLVENSDVIEQYINDVMLLIRPTTNLDTAFNSDLIFEAIKEDPALKVKVLSRINENSKKTPWFFTNTSSIPIGELDNNANLGGRLLGVHFYNPPAIQRLVEVIKGNNTIPEMLEFVAQYARNLRKIIVPSNDFAGFIGNGHFMRDAIYGISEAEKLAKERSMAEGIYMINRVTQDYLIRPMGIFQLIDYVGIDVCQYIMSVMNPYLTDEDLHSQLLDDMLAAGVRGGQNSDGTQKDGFLKYEKNRPVGIYNINTKDYVPVESIQADADNKLGGVPASVKPWKAVLGVQNKEEYFRTYFDDLKGTSSLGAELARNFSLQSKKIGMNLVKDKVAQNEKDVNTVLLTGFYHAYGPINSYLD